MITFIIIIEKDRTGRVNCKVRTPASKSNPDEVSVALKFQDLIRQAMKADGLTNNEGLRQFAKPHVN